MRSFSKNSRTSILGSLVLMIVAFLITPQANAQGDFTFTANPQSIPIANGQATSFDVAVKATGGFNEQVKITIGTLPTGVVTTPTGSLLINPGEVATIEIAANSSVSLAPPAIQQLILTATSTTGSPTHTAQVELTIGAKPDYILQSSDVGLSLVAGSTQSLTVTATALNGFTGTSIPTSVTGLPSGVTVSPASFTPPATYNLTPGTPETVTISADSTVATGTYPMNFHSTYGSTTHDTPVVLNIGAQTQDFVFAVPKALSIHSNTDTTVLDFEANGVGGFDGHVNFSVTLPVDDPITPTYSRTWVNTGPGGDNHATVTLAATAFTGAANKSITVTATAVTSSGINLTHTATVLLSEAPPTTVTATVNTTSPGTAFQPYFVGFSISELTQQEFFGTASTTSPAFINLLSNFKTYIGSPMLRVALPSTTAEVSQLGAVKTGATFTVGSTTVSPHFFLTTNTNYDPSSAATFVQSVISAVGGAHTAGIELDNEPDFYVSGGKRPATWTYSDYLTETAGYDTAITPYLVVPPQLVATAEGGRYWDMGVNALKSQMYGQLSFFTAHLYPLSSCDTPAPTTTNLLDDYASHQFYSRFAALTATLISVPVRVGEMNSTSCQGTPGVSNSFASSLWLVDAAFEAKSANAVGFNVHSNGQLYYTDINGNQAGGPIPYDVAYNNSTTTNGSITVYAPFYGMLFFSEAIQNGAQPLPVTMTQIDGNVKVWATIDASNAVRVVVLEKDTDGTSHSKTVALDLGSYYKSGGLSVMTAPAVGSTSGITIAGQTFDGTTNGLLTGTLIPPTSVSPTVLGSDNIYTITVQDGTAAMLTIPY